MTNILDYLDWRGDITFEYAPLNEVDALILSELSYLNFQGIANSWNGISLSDAACIYFDEGRQEQKNTGDLMKESYFIMLKKLSACRRFSGIRLMGYIQKTEEETNMQFSAVTIQLGKKQLFIAFRGTDDTLLCWKEDFLMSVLDTVPSQKEALAYLYQVYKQLPGKRLYLGGHSKGGNLAVYSAVHAAKCIQNEILTVFNLDGPGFKESLVDTASYQAVQERIVTFVPQSSVVGMLLEHEENYIVVKSSEKGLMQHDGFSWEVLGTAFLHLESVTRESRIADMAIRSVLGSMTDEQRMLFTNTLFEILESKKNRTLNDIRKEGLPAFRKMLKTYDNLDYDTRKMLLSVFSKTLTAGMKEYRRISASSHNSSKEISNKEMLE